MLCFLDHDYEFVDVVKVRLSSDPTEAEPAFLKIVEKMKEDDVVVWTFGAWIWFVPVQMQYLFDKLFTWEGYDFYKKNKMFDYPSTGVSSAVMRFLFKSKKLEKKLIASREKRIIKEREERFKKFTKTGTSGKGKNIAEIETGK